MVTDTLIDIIQIAYLRGFTTKSNFARRYVNEIAMAACEGLLTTRVSPGVYSSEWRPTIKGLALLNEWELDDADVN